MFSSFRSRLIIIFGGLLAGALAVTLFAVGRAHTANAERLIKNELAQDAAVFRRLVEVRANHLLESARVLSREYSFKEAYSIGEEETIVSAMGNFMSRTEEADVMLLLSLDAEVLASTEEEPVAAEDDPWLDLVYLAEDDEYGEASTILVYRGRLFQMMVVPLMMPDLEAWVATGFLIDQEFVDDFSRLVLSDITMLTSKSDSDWISSATTLGDSEATALLAQPNPSRVEGEGDAIETLDLGGQAWIASPLLLVEEPSAVLAILQRSLTEELAPYDRVLRLLAWIFLAALLLSVLATGVAARSVTRPVLAVANAARRIEEGDYEQQLDIQRSDEIGQMANSFNHMARGLAEKEKVRNLLGKVVSPAIAEELMSRDIELGGEEREVTVLFSDVRDFTALCEGRSPRDILELLNLYLTEVSTVISDRGGVVDKYIGDAVMALFGAPLKGPDDPSNAVAAALAMVKSLDQLNPQLQNDGWPELKIGVGINTGEVVAGNMGSRARLNYTVIGDGVNLASRLEGLTKVYGVPILVSQSTVERAEAHRFRELDLVQVKGKTESVAVYEPLAAAGNEAAAQTDDRFAVALAHYRSQDWNSACQGFREFALGSANGAYRTLTELYLGRIERFRIQPPPADWDGTYAFSEK